MFSIEQKNKPSLLEALFITTLIIFIIFSSIYFLNSTPHIPIIISILILIFYGLLKKVSYRDLEQGMITGAKSGLGAIYIFLLIGILISSWIIGGTIPTLLYFGLSFVTASFFYAIVFVISAVIGTAIGSSLTTVATVGVAFITVASAVDVSLAITAGAIVSGAFFGDKMSPLSDTTNLAASIVHIDIFEHIKNMSWTTIPAFLLSTLLYAVLSPSLKDVDLSQIIIYKNVLVDLDLVHFYSILPLIVLVGCTLFKVPAFLTLVYSAIAGCVLSLFHMDISLEQFGSILYSGYVSQTGNEVIDALLTRGGLSSMYFTMFLVILSLSMGGLLFVLGIIQRLLATVEHLLRSTGSAITGAALTAVGINTVIGEQYLSILLTGETFKEKFKELQLHPKNLARVMEDAGTVINPLVPWSVCGLFIATMLNVSVMEYLPFAFFCLISPLLTIIFGWLNITITKTTV